MKFDCFCLNYITTAITSNFFLLKMLRLERMVKITGQKEGIEKITGGNASEKKKKREYKIVTNFKYIKYLYNKERKFSVPTLERMEKESLGLNYSQINFRY